jgi:hypothetical protein
VTRTIGTSTGIRYALGAAALGASLLLASPAATHAAQDNWGQEVKACNQTDCYPGGTSRGGYVRGQAKDDDADQPGRGYGEEIHALANPGNADPNLP